MRVATGVALAIALALTGACGGDAPRAPATPVAAAAPAKAGASADGMCREHGVLEALCTKCKPALAAVFQAKGDWCTEHGFPESICPICHPERGGRPAVDVSATTDGGPAEGTKVKFKTPDTARLAGIETAKVEVMAEAMAITVTARVLYDGTRVAAVNARSGGVVEAIRADVGAAVKAGETLASIASAEVGAERSRSTAARARAEMAEAAWARQKELHAKGIAPYNDVLAAERELSEARAELSSVEASLSIVGPSLGTGARYAVVSPLSGVVTERHATVGMLVAPGDPLYQVVDTSSMWVELDVPEAELAAVASGQEVTVEVPSIGHRTWKGAIAYVAPAVDPQTRTAKARVSVANPDGALRANMFARARIALPAGRHVLVPAAAVQQAKGVDVAFVRLSDGEYETRRVETMKREGDRVVLARGLRAGEDVVTSGSFFLMTETLKDSIGAGCCDVE